MLASILSNTFTTADAYKRLLVLEDVLQHALYGGDHHSDILELLRARADAKAIAEWGTQVFDSFTKETLAEDMQELKDAIGRLPTLTVYTPVVFEQKHLETIGSWCREHIDTQILLDVRVDPQASGGCMFVWRDTLYDFSLQYFMKQRASEFRAYIASLSAERSAPAAASSHT